MIKSSEFLKLLAEKTGYDWRDRSVKIVPHRGLHVMKEVDELEIHLEQMYEFPEFSFDFLSEISTLLDTKNINIGNQDSHSGCETCDYGSSYELTLYVKDCKNKILIDCFELEK